jgi:DNA-binding PadR family transcriptional regulator
VAKRKVANLLALVVLGTVVQRPMHPYEIATLLRERGKDDDVEIKWGSLYTVVRNLAKHGFLEVVDNRRDGARPERTIYAITAAGRAELVDWTRELVANPRQEHPQFRAGLSLLAALTPDEAARALGERLTALDSAVAAGRESLAAQLAGGLPRLFLVEVEYDLAVRAAEADWVRGLLDELTSGTLPGIAEWRHWHETGELPADLPENRPAENEAADTGPPRTTPPRTDPPKPGPSRTGPS